MLVSGPNQAILLYHLGMQAKSHMMTYDKQLTNFTLMYDEEDII